MSRESLVIAEGTFFQLDGCTELKKQKTTDRICCFKILAFFVVSRRLTTEFKALLEFTRRACWLGLEDTLAQAEAHKISGFVYLKFP